MSDQDGECDRLTCGEPATRYLEVRLYPDVPDYDGPASYMIAGIEVCDFHATQESGESLIKWDIIDDAFDQSQVTRPSRTHYEIDWRPLPEGGKSQVGRWIEHINRNPEGLVQ